MTPIDLQTLVADAMAQHPDATRDELEAALVAGVETRIERQLTERENADLCVELYGQWNERYAIVVGARVIRTDTSCIPGKVLAIDGTDALVVWGMDVGSGERPQREPIADLELDITAEWYLAEKREQRTPWPGGDVRGIPTFNDANRAHIEAMAERQGSVLVAVDMCGAIWTGVVGARKQEIAS